MWFQLLKTVFGLVFILPAHLLMRLCTALSQVTENAHKVLLSDSIFFILKIILSYLLIYGVAFQFHHSVP